MTYPSDISLPEKVELLINILNSNEYAAYIVGGCVRDFIMGIEPHDWDITTNATPDEIRKVFENNIISTESAEIRFKVIPTGEKYGTMTIEVIEKWTYNKIEHSAGIYEITTFRADSEYSDGRRPDNVTFGESIIDDLARRDFTINAIAYNPLVGYVDPFDGIKDIEKKLIRGVGNADKRIKEDALRILRGIRFACKYKFNLENCTRNVIAESGSLLKNVSKERIQNELLKILTYSKDNQQTLNWCIEVFGHIFELVKEDQETDALRISKWNSNKLIEVINNNNPISIKLFNMLKLYKEKYKAEIWLRKYKFSNDMIKVIMAYYNINTQLDLTFLQYKETKRYDILLKCLFNKFDYKIIINYINNDLEYRLNTITNIDKLKQLIQEPFRISDLDINGHDLIKLGLDGEEVGKCLNYLLEKVIEDKNLNESTILKDMTKKYLEEISNGECN